MTETDFFRLIDNPGSTGLGTAYNEFTTTVVYLCKERESACRTVFALSYAETELQYHDAMQETDSSRSMYVRKALSFVRKMLKYYQVRLHRGGAFDGGEKTNQRQDEAAAMQWTGSTAELVELIYGLDEMKLINGGETGIKELLARFCRMFGVEIKENQCYNTYADIKRRKNESRTYFFDRAAERLNRRRCGTRRRNGRGGEARKICLYRNYPQEKNTFAETIIIQYIMALEIKAIPTLKGKEAERFVKEADKAYQKKEKTDFSKQVKIARAILRKANMI